MKISRRDFLRLAGAGAFVGPSLATGEFQVEEERMGGEGRFPLRLQATELVKGMARENREAPIPNGEWYVGDSVGQGLLYRFPTGALARSEFLTGDLLVDGKNLVTFALTLSEGDDGPTFLVTFGALCQCQTRVRLRLDAVKQNVWKYRREGGWLKILCGGDRVDLSKVDRMKIVVAHKAEGPVRFCLTDMAAVAEEPPRLLEPILPKGPLLDKLGQSTLHDWPGKTRTSEEVTARLRTQLEEASQHAFPAGFSQWGGCRELKFDGTGYFRTEHDGKRWWLVDPEGCAFWSTGPDCVRIDAEAPVSGLEKAFSWLPDPEGKFERAYTRWGRRHQSVYYLAANLIEAFGPDEWHERWVEIVLGELRRVGMNTVGNWSEWRIAREAGFPYVRPLDRPVRRTPRVFRDMPDVFDPRFEEEAAEFAEQLRETADDPALIGYFLMNEPTWGFSRRPAAEGMMFNAPSCAARRELAEFLRKRHGSDAGLAAAWGMDVRLSEVAEGEWTKPFPKAASGDLEAFSTVMADRLFRELTAACKRVDPHHLNLGARYGDPPQKWALDGMRCFDVFSANCYEPRVNQVYAGISEYLRQPIIIGEFHFGALDVGLPASGLMRVRDQAARGQAFRVYIEDAAAQPWCVGAHWFTLYDQSALGRFDGENLNIGFFDICHRRYEALCDAARATHERLYDVASGSIEPYADAPDYLPIVFA